jgi:putative PIN family toxin of toxin-antitoxin system
VTATRIVLDTNVLVSAIRSDRGASFRLLSLVGTGQFDVCLSVALVLEYEGVMKRETLRGKFRVSVIDDILDYVCQVGQRCEVYFLWRPSLPDPNDDMLLELAVAGGCDVIVTFNTGHFVGSEKFGIRVLTPRQFLIEIGALP